MADTSRGPDLGSGRAPVRVSLEEGVARGLQSLPPSAGVAQIEGPEGRSLLITRTVDIRKWSASNLGAGPSPRPGVRPKIDLSGVATAVSFVLAGTAFERTLVFERWMACLVPYEKRKDLKAPAFLEVDTIERFPRISIVVTPGPRAFGPFRDRKGAERALAALHKAFPLRPCDFSFEPHPELPLGRGCLYAQVRSCAAPCLGRVTEGAYRDLAERAVAALTSPRAREGALASAVPTTVGAARGRGLVVSRVRGGGVLHPVSRGRVKEGIPFVEGAIDQALASLEWDIPESLGDDWPWLSSWLHSPAGRASFVVVSEEGELAAAVGASLSHGP